MEFSFKDAYLYNWQELYYFELENDMCLDAFHILNNNIENSLKSTKQEFTKLIDQDSFLSNLNENDKSNYYSQIYYREELALLNLQRLQRYSLCLSLFSFFEGRLKSICSSLELEFHLKKKVKELAAPDDLSKYWDYLDKVFKMKMNTFKIEFSIIKKIKLVRNLVAHNEGFLDKRMKNRLDSIIGISFTEIENRYRIEIAENIFIDFLLSQMSFCLSKISISINNRCKDITIKN